jgi:prepilin-type processing-associated H-X9-DG protein
MTLSSDPRYYKSRYQRIADIPGGVAMAVDAVNYTASSYVHPNGVNALYADSSASFNNVNVYQTMGNRIIAFDKVVWPMY